MQVTFVKFAGKSSAIVMAGDGGGWARSQTAVYVPASQIPEGAEKGLKLEVPDNLKIVDMVDFTTGEVRKALNGAPLKVFAAI